MYPLCHYARYMCIILDLMPDSVLCNQLLNRNYDKIVYRYDNPIHWSYYKFAQKHNSIITK